MRGYYYDAELALSGGNLKTIYEEAITIECSSGFVDLGQEKTFTFTTEDDSGEEITEGLTYTLQGVYMNGSTVSATYYDWSETTDPNKVKFKTTIPVAGKYTIVMNVLYKGTTYSKTQKITVKEPWAPTSTPSLLPSGTTGSAGTSAKYLYLGDWPQTIKASNVEIDESKTKTQGAFTYYLGDDGDYYVKCMENAYETGYSYSDGGIITESSGQSYKYFKVEPIKWRVLTENYNGTGKWLLLAENILSVDVYYDNYIDNRTISGSTVYPGNYLHSRIRAYLNGIAYNKEGAENSEFVDHGFLQTAFTADLQSRIITTEVINDADSTDDIDGWHIKADADGSTHNEDYTCANTNDKVFLLSVREAREPDFGFSSIQDADTVRQKAPTDYAKCNQAKAESGIGEWWLRSPFFDYYSIVRVVYTNGDAQSNNGSSVYKYVNQGGIGIVPAICIDAP